VRERVCERACVLFFQKRERVCTFFGDEVCVFLAPRIKALFPSPWSCSICVCEREGMCVFSSLERVCVVVFCGQIVCVFLV